MTMTRAVAIAAAVFIGMASQDADAGKRSAKSKNTKSNAQAQETAVKSAKILTVYCPKGATVCVNGHTTQTAGIVRQYVLQQQKGSFLIEITGRDGAIQKTVEDVVKVYETKHNYEVRFCALVKRASQPCKNEECPKCKCVKSTVKTTSVSLESQHVENEIDLRIKRIRNLENAATEAQSRLEKAKADLNRIASEKAEIISSDKAQAVLNLKEAALEKAVAGLEAAVAELNSQLADEKVLVTEHDNRPADTRRAQLAVAIRDLRAKIAGQQLRVQQAKAVVDGRSAEVTAARNSLATVENHNRNEAQRSIREQQLNQQVNTLETAALDARQNAQEAKQGLATLRSNILKVIAESIASEPDVVPESSGTPTSSSPGDSSPAVGAASNTDA